MEWWLPGVGGGEKPEVFNESIEFQFSKVKKVWRLAAGHVNMLNTAELALSEAGKFYVLCFCHHLKINANRRIPIKGPSLVSHT